LTKTDTILIRSGFFLWLPIVMVLMAVLETVRSGEYAIARPLFMITNGYPVRGSHLDRFLALRLTIEGQKIIQDIGLIPITDHGEGQ
jgi:ABC-type phosphate transport system substrate-binding protein